MIRIARLAVGCVLLATPALAEGPATGQDYEPSRGGGAGRPDTRALTCAEAFALVARAGAVVMTTGPVTYGRIVRDGGFCTIEMTTRPDYETTRDERACFVGYRCVDRIEEGRDGP